MEVLRVIGLNNSLNKFYIFHFKIFISYKSIQIFQIYNRSQSMSNTIMKRTSDPEINNEFNLEFVSIQTQQPYNYDELAMKFCPKSKRTRIQRIQWIRWGFNGAFPNSTGSRGALSRISFLYWTPNVCIPIMSIRHDLWCCLLASQNFWILNKVVRATMYETMTWTYTKSHNSWK